MSSTNITLPGQIPCLSHNECPPVFMCCLFLLGCLRASECVSRRERENKQTKYFAVRRGDEGQHRARKTRDVGDDDVKEDMDDVADFLFRILEYRNTRMFQQIN